MALKKDDTPKRTKNNSIKGQSKEVFPLKRKEDIEAIEKYLRNRIENDEYNEVAGRNLLIFTVGMNMYLKPSELLALKWSDVFCEKYSFIEVLKMDQTNNQTNEELRFNYIEVHKAINEYFVRYKPDIEDYVFKSRQGGYLDVNTFTILIKKVASECGIKQNVGSETLRKTYVYYTIQKNYKDLGKISRLSSSIGKKLFLKVLEYFED